MIKNIIISLLGAALIQPFWSLTTTWQEVAITYLITFWGLFTLIVNVEEWLQGKIKDPGSGNSQVRYIINKLYLYINREMEELQ